MHETKKQSTIDDIWLKAKIHQDASSVGIPCDIDNYHLCQCCDQPIRKQPIPLCQHTKQFQIFGFGYPLWFSFVKYCICLIVLLIATNTSNEIYQATKQNYDFCYGKHTNSHISAPASSTHKIHDLSNDNIIHLRQNEDTLPLFSQFQQYDHYKHEPLTKQASHHPPSIKSPTVQQHQQQCTSFMIYLANIKGDVLRNTQFLKTIAFLIHLIALVVIRNMILKQEQYYDQRTTSLSDYSLLIKNLPQVYGSKTMLIDFFQAQFGKTYGKPNSQIKQIYYIFESQEINQIVHEKKKLHSQKLKAIDHEKYQEIEQIQNKEKHLTHQLEQVTKQINLNIKKDYIKCDKMIVIMNTQGEKAQVLSSFEEKQKKQTDLSVYFKHPGLQGDKKVKIQISQAPQPNQINWEHIDQSDNARKFLIVRGYLMTFLFLGIVTVVFYFFMLAKTKLFLAAMEEQHHSKDPNDSQIKMFKIFATFIVFVAIFGVIFFNKFVMGKVLHIFVHMEKHAYIDKQNHSFSIKYALGMFFTTALMTLAVQAITFKNFYSHPFGVIEQQTIMFFVTAFFIPLVWLIHPYNLCKKLQFKHNQNTLVHQQVANQLIENFPYDLGKRYAQILEIMWFTFLYSKLIPLGSFLVLIGLSLYYWVDKYNFLRRSTLKQGISGKMAIYGLKSLDCTLFLTYAGDVLFEWVLNHHFSKSSCLLMVLGLIYLIIPVTKIIWKLNGQKFLLSQKTYDQVKYSFRQNYFTLHPVYRYTHKAQIQQYKRQVIKRQRQQFKKIKMFGTGRGSYVKDHHNEQNSNTKKHIQTSRTQGSNY